jgi:outer membrane protein assembly factor BamD (BamD/ComL family)
MAAVISVLSVGLPQAGWQQSKLLAAETWHLQKGQDWKAVHTEKDKYLLAVAEIKQLVNMGQTEAVRKSVNRLKRDFPEIAGPDLDAFMQAEMLYCEGKFTEAVRSYDKFLSEYPESPLTEAALTRQFAIATAFLSGQKKRVLKILRIKGYAEGIKIMESITDRAGNAPIAVKAAVACAESYEKRGKFDQAYHKWSQIQSRWPIGRIAKKALLGMARCKHAAYKGPTYDASDLISANSYYQNFKERYPQDAEELDIDGKLKQINEQLAYKHFRIGRYYQQTGSKQSANFYYQMVMDNWPETTAAEMVKIATDEKTRKKEKIWQKGIRKLENLLL